MTTPLFLGTDPRRTGRRNRRLGAQTHAIGCSSFADSRAGRTERRLKGRAGTATLVSFASWRTGRTTAPREALRG
jgi:hypothetical protein